MAEKEIIVVGPGRMGIEYAKVLIAAGKKFTVIGRGEESAANFLGKTGVTPVTGGIDNYLKKGRVEATHAIIAVNVSDLSGVCQLLLKAGVKNILLEKPGSLTSAELNSMQVLAESAEAKVSIGYNRRFLPTVSEARRILGNDGGVKSVHFEFTEWSEKVAVFDADSREKEHWFLSNSSHVADLAFFLAGKPVKMESFVEGSFDWHQAGSVFSGSGITDRGALFSYCANWDAPGRWGVEAMSKNYRIILRPMEELVIQKRGSVVLEKIDIGSLSKEGLKPGLEEITKEFLEGGSGTICTLSEQAYLLPFYQKIAGYKLG